MAKRFDGQVVWITGGGSGIGAALAKEMARRGAAVAVSGRRVDRLAQVVAAVEAAGGKALAVACDVTDEASLAAAVESIVAKLGRLDVAVANAGMGVMGKVETLTAEEWNRQLSINVTGAALTAKHALPSLRAARGRLVLVGSVAGFLVGPKAGAYSASKYAVRALGETLAIELHGSGVSCTTVHPGFVASEIAQVGNDGVFDASANDPRPKRLMLSAERAAVLIANAVYKRRYTYAFPFYGKLGVFFGSHMPWLLRWLQTR
jgi:NAD(P)-dependent dehydrogenase (short-subunit alcohol dehydrogenase family)